jgi:AMP deaminase
MFKSRQRLGDDPRHYDGHFPGLDEDRSDVSGVRPDANFTDNQPPIDSYKPWRIYPRPPPPHWHWTDQEKIVSSDGTYGSSKDGFRFERCEIPGPHPWTFELDDKGVYQVYDEAQGTLVSIRAVSSLCSAVLEKEPVFDIPSIREYFVDLDYILSIIADGPTKSFAFRRLKYLASKFDMYALLNEFQELADMKVRILDAPSSCRSHADYNSIARSSSVRSQQRLVWSRLI